jgi:hypothetical protein
VTIWPDCRSTAPALGLRVAPIEVRDLDDRQMVRMLASENATQRGSTSAACLDAVAAIARVLAYNLLRWDEASFCKIPQKPTIDYPRCRGRLEAGEGIGRDCIQAFAPAGAFTITQVENALGTLKDSGRMASIIADAYAKASVELRAEQKAAERALVEAKAQEARASTEAERAVSACPTSWTMVSSRTPGGRFLANRT